MKTKSYPRKTYPYEFSPKGLSWSAIAIVLLSLASSFTARAQIQQVNALPGLPNPTDTTIWNTNNTTIYQASGNQNTRIPFALGIDVDNGGTIVKKVLLSWGVNPDFIDGQPAPAEVWRRNSLDGGLTWGTVDTNAGSNGNVSYLSAIRRRNGEMVALSFTPTDGYFRSTNNGVSWTKYTDGTVPLVMKFHRGIIEEPNPTDSNIHDLFAVGYSGWDCVLVKSTNGGKDWTYVSTPADGNTDGDGRRYNESTIERCSDGSWLVVSRDEWYTATSEMRWRRSTNKGQSWLGTGTSELAGLPAPESDNVRDCDPYLKLMPNGVLVLTYGPTNVNDAGGWPGGSRDCHVAFSADGTGASWTNHVILLKGSTEAVGLESSGYGGAVPVSAHRFLTYSDTGQSWSYSTEFPTPNPYTIWGRYVDIVRTNQQNRIDLKTKLALTPSMVTTDLTYSDAAHPEARISGAVDGSTDYWSGAFKSGTSGTYTINLQSVHRLTAIALCMQYNTAQSATIHVSLDGTNWSTTPVKSFANKIHNALTYVDDLNPTKQNFDVPISAQYVRVTVNGSGSLVCLNEIELYGTTDTFENNATQSDVTPHGIVPPGYTSAGTNATQYGFSVKDATGAAYQSTRGLKLWDSSSNWLAGIKKTPEGTKSKQLEFKLKPTSYGSGGVIAFSIRAQVTSGIDTAYHFAVFSDGGIKWYGPVGGVTTWRALSSPGAGAGTVPTNSWTTIRVNATVSPNNAAVHVNGTFKGNATMYATPANVVNLTGFSFGSAGTGAFGDSAYIDDVSLTEFTTLSHTYEGDTVGAVPAGYDAGSTLCTVSSTRAQAGTKSLRVFDNSTGAVASIVKTNAIDPADSKALEFYAWMQAVPNAFTFGIKGQVTAGSTSVYHLGVFPDGSVRYYNTATWVTLSGGGAGTVSTLASWNKIRVEGNKTAANVYINNKWIGTAGMNNSPANVTKLNGYSFSSGGTLSTGEDVYIDTVYFGY